MPDFDTARDQLTHLRQEVERARKDALLAREAMRQAERALAGLERGREQRRGDGGDPLRAKLKEAREWSAQAAAELKRLQTLANAALKEFEALADPRDRLGAWPSDNPILLFPLRLETRFKTGPAGTPQLWVRVYPDTCLIDTFEAALTEQEVANAQAFWARMWRAGGREGLERDSWRELVASHGSGRAGWIVRQYLPLNPGLKPVEGDGSDIRLVIVAHAPLPSEALTYWEDAWRAEGNAAGQQAAYDDLEDDLDAAQAAEIVERYRPFNFEDAPASPLTRQTAKVQVVVLQVASAESLATRRSSWSSPAHIDLLPERFVLVATPRTGTPVTAIGGIISTPLIASPDPNAPSEQQLKQADDTLEIPPDLAWMFDFEKAVDAGMALRVDLTAAQARDGFERVVVLGVRLGDSADEGRANLAQLLEHHLHSRGGLEILPQGTPTNNTESSAAGYSFREDADATFDIFVREAAQYAFEADPLLRRDGQWLAELLALPEELVQRIPHAGGTDQSDARAMQIALWPGTLGYTMKTMLAPVFSQEDVGYTRSFFTRYVTGRGPVPALRIGRQPYGIVPATAFDRITWTGSGADRGDDRGSSYLQRLYTVLRRIDEDWKPLLDQVSYIGKPGTDPHQTLLDVLGLHPGSAEFYPLEADSVTHKYYELTFLNISISLGLLDWYPVAIPLTLLSSFGYAGKEIPDLLNKIYQARQTPLDGPLVDDRPLSEREPVRRYAGDKNYIQWLAATARSGIAALQQEQGFDGGKKPAALLYLMLRHALQLAFYETGVKLQQGAGLENQAMLREPEFVHVTADRGSESRYGVLYHPEERITGATGTPLGDYIAGNIAQVDTDLNEQVEALERLAQVPTAGLERAFAEHVDCCGYRLDAWKMGLQTLRLEFLRSGQKGREAQGMYLGAFGWLEPLRPTGRTLTPANLPQDIATPVNRQTQAPLMRDSSNAGLVHAPSLNHATTASVLRSGYLANDGRLAVNLSSRRVRLALGILEGMRNGQSLGALLGYQFERHVHDHGPLEVRDLIYALRREFPLAANQISTTNTESGSAEESIAAMNVVDGRKLIAKAESTKPAVTTYPFSVGSLPRRPAAQEQALTNALAHIRDINDAVADLVLAEGVHQAVLGNYERSAGTMDAFAKGNNPPEPDVIRTPRTGVALTLRAAIHLSPTPPVVTDPTPLALAEPAVNAWLKDRLPAPSTVGCQVVFINRTTGAEDTVVVTQKQLGLHPIDLLYRAQAGADQALGDLDDQIVRYVQTKHSPRHDRPIRILHTARVGGYFSWFELQALLRSLRSLLTASRPLQPADLMRANDATRAQQAMTQLPPERIEDARDDLRDTLLPNLDAAVVTLKDATVEIDEALSGFVDAVAPFAAYRLPQTGVGFAYEWRAGVYSGLADKLTARVEDWDRRLARFKVRVDAYDLNSTATPEERIALLGSAELILSTELTLPAPLDPTDYRDNVLEARRTAFVAKRDALLELVTAARPTLAQLLDDAKNELPLSAFDPNALEFTEDDAEVARFRLQLIAAAAALKEDVRKRIARVDAILASHGTATGGEAKVRLLQDAAKVLFGEDFQLVPHITLPPATVDELTNAWQHSRSGKLTDYLTTTSLRDFPVDDWMHGVARVREKMHHWENVVLLADAVGVPSAELTPLQLPYHANEPWLAMEMPATHEITSDRLLYTAHFAEPFDSTAPICGMLVDEWTEVIPGTRETTGIAFHYDRPNSEPPQAWLLAVPAARSGTWSWEELLAAVNDTLDAAKRRAIEPAQVDRTAYSWFLPATISAYTFPEISISNNLLRNVNIYAAALEG